MPDGDGKPSKKRGRTPKAGRLDPNAPLDDASPEIIVGDTPTHDATINDLLSQLSEERRKEIDKEARRAAHANYIGGIRWSLAQHVHKLEDGNKLNFDDYPFQVEIYRDASIEKVIYGSVQWGKTEYCLVTAIAQASAGMRVLYINSKKDKRERLVKTRVDPSLKSVKVYKELARKAAAKGKDTFSTMIKHLGDGSIVFLIASADREFSQQSGDSAFVDEFDECNGNNIFKLDDRMSGSWMRFKEFVGNPTLKGTEANQNIDWQFQNSDRRYWHVVCDSCKEPQLLEWEQHCVSVERNEHGGILSITPLDKEYKMGGRLDMRPVCMVCQRPMDRLSHNAFWKPLNPGHPRHGYNLSNLYNPNKRLDELFRMYLVARHSPEKMQAFINNQLGKPHNQEGTGITDEMLVACSTGKAVGAAPYRFVPAEMIQWGSLAARATEEVA